MKKSIKHLIAFMLAVVFMISCVTTVIAETIYYYYGYLYTYISNTKVSLYGLDDGITTLEVPEIINGRAVVDIRNYAFSNDETLTAVDFSNASNLERIGSYAFRGCSNLTGTVTLPASLSRIGDSAFQNCDGIDGISIDTLATVIPPYFCYDCEKLSTAFIGENINEISDYAFAHCPSLSYVVIPAEVETISDSAFDSDVVTLGVYTNSYAHQYAIDNEIPFILLDAPIPTEPPTEPEPTEAPTEETTVPATEAPTEVSVKYLGDVDGDGTVTSIDATLIQRHLCYIKTMISDEMIMMGDVDDDGIISIIDVSFIMRYLATIEVPYPIGEPIINN